MSSEDKLASCRKLLDLLPPAARSKSFYLFVSDDDGASSFSFVMDSAPRVEPGEVAPAAFGLHIHALDFTELVEGYGDVRALLADGRLRIEGDLGAGTLWVQALAASGPSR
jgi:hypothetical protein